MAVSPRLWYEFGAFRLDPLEKVLFENGLPVSLTPKALETLVALVGRHGHVVTKEELLRIVWPDTFVEENNLAQNISTLRRVLGDSEDGRPLIETVPKRGYRFVGPVAEQGDAVESAVAAPAESPIVAPGGSLPPARTPTGTAVRRWMLWGLIAAVSVAFVIVAKTWMIDRRPESVRPGAAGLTRMAVLPFVNLGSPGDEYFVAGMTEEIASRLAGLRRLAVASSTTVAGYDRRGKTVGQVGADLRVEYIVEGSVRWAQRSAGPQVRITPKLIRVADDTVVWTQQYDASLSDLFKVQADIAYQITGALQVALEARERRMVDSRPTADTEAYLMYLRGITAIQQGSSDTRNQTLARTDLEQAVARDPRFAPAWSWLARVYAWQYGTGADRKPETRQLAQRAAQTAFGLKPGLADAHLAMAQVLLLDRNYEAALNEVNIAHDSLPNSPELLRMMGVIEQRKGHWSGSLSAYMRAFDLDPVASADVISIHYMHMRQYSEANRFIEILKAGNRTNFVVQEAWMRFSESGDIISARRLLESALSARAPGDARVRGLLARLEWFDGRHQRALDLIAEMDPAGAWLPANFRFPASLAAGQVYESMGRRDEAARHYSAAIADLERKQRTAPDDYQIEAALGLAFAGLGRPSEAVRHGQRAVALLPVTRDAAEGPLYLYWLAQIHARIGQPAAAFAALDEMFRVPGFYNETWVQRDPGFSALRSHPMFRAHIDRWSSQKGDALLDARGPR